MSDPLRRIDAELIAADLQRLLRVPSLTGDERAVMEETMALARERGLTATLVEHDLAGLRAKPGYPGEEAGRTELLGVIVELPGADRGAPRLALNGHVDVVPAGTVPWRHAGGPWSGERVGDRVYGRGSVDMKGGVVAAVHALAAIATAGVVPPAGVDLLVVGSEEDGGLGTFAALERHDHYAACLIPEPTELDVVSAQAGALTFDVVVGGVAAHAASRLSGVSAIDRYVRVHAALAAYEVEINADVADPLMAELELAYPVSVGRIEAGEWSSSVPDRLRFEGRVAVRVGEDVARVRHCVERLIREAAAGDGPDPSVAWTGGQFASGSTPPDDPFLRRVRSAARAELGVEPVVRGVPWGADLRLFTERGIPTAMFGPRGIARAHGVDEWVSVRELETVARVIARVVSGG